MTTSFSQYASKFLNNRAGPSSSIASSQPLFYSFQDSEDGEGSVERVKISIQSHDELELDEHGEPRLRGDVELDDPYLRLDEDDELTLKESGRLITSEMPSTQGGWLAHQTSPLPSRSPSPLSSPALPDISALPLTHSGPSRTTLAESLLPRDGISRPTFSLPEPGRVPRHKYNDTLWTVLWCSSIGICLLVFFLSFFFITNTSGSTPYTVLAKAIPLLTFLIIMCTGFSYIYILLLRYFARPVLILTALFVPVSLVLSAVFSFSGSYIYDTWTIWDNTIGLRLFSIIPLVLAFFAARSFLWYISQINGTVGIVQLATSFLLSNIPLLAVSPFLLFVALLSCLPFISLIVRLLSMGNPNNSEWHIRPYALWMVIAVCFVWMWSWCLVRGILRVTAAGAVGAWFFGEQLTDETPNQIRDIRAAFARAYGPSIGTICLSALIQAVLGSFLFFLRGMRSLTRSPMFPTWLHPLSVVITLLSRKLTPLNFDLYLLPYVGLTGESFSASSRRVRELTSVKRLRVMPPSYGLLPTLMTLSSLTLSMLLALFSYVFVSHALSSPKYAALSALLTGGMAFFASWFCGSIVGDTADALYMCYCVARESDIQHRGEVFEIFEGLRPVNEP